MGKEKRPREAPLVSSASRILQRHQSDTKPTLKMRILND